MDCEKCDPLLIDELYGELDDVTSAAVRRHVAGCARCSEAFEKLSGGKKLAAMMQEPAPDGLEMRILEATKEAQKVVPIRGRGSRALSWAGSWAMRPQTAMAALFLLMIGSSAVFLGKGRDSSAPSVAAEQWAPAATVIPIERDRSAMAEAPAPQAMASSAPALGAAAQRGAPADDRVAQEARPSPPPAPMVAAKENAFDSELGSGGARAKASTPMFAGAEPKQSADSEGQLWSANSAYRSQNYSEATRLYDQSAKKGDLEAELGAARSVRDGTGCPSAVIRYDALASHAPGTSQANAATFESAKCYESFGDYDAATARFKKLGGTSYAAQAKAEIDKMNTMVKSKGGSVTGGAAAAKPSAPRMEAAPKKLPSISGSMD